MSALLREHTPRPVRFDIHDAQAAANGHFNCGPAALCAVADLLPNQAVSSIPDFLKRHYTNPTMMQAALRALKIPFTRVYECNAGMITGWTDDGLHAGVGLVAVPGQESPYPEFGLVRIQWAGPWTRPGVPIYVRYRHSHWIACSGEWRFDVNAMCVGGWIPRKEWERDLVPWLIKECEPKASGGWWPTHCWAIAPPARLS